MKNKKALAVLIVGLISISIGGLFVWSGRANIIPSYTLASVALVTLCLVLIFKLKFFSNHTIIGSTLILIPNKILLVYANIGNGDAGVISVAVGFGAVFILLSCIMHKRKVS